MQRKDFKYYAFIVIILSVVVIVEVFKPKPVDWTFSLERKDKIPYGTYVLFNTLKEVFPGKSIYENKQSVWQFSKKNTDAENIIFITRNFFPDKLDTEEILKKAEEGKNIFVSAHYFSGKFSDTLNIESGNDFFLGGDTSSSFNFYNKKLKSPDSFVFLKSSGFTVFTSFDTLNSVILAYNKNNKPVFLKTKFGKGSIFLSTVPEAFTNYGMITEKNYEFAYKMLSYLPVENTVWDEYYKPFRKHKKNSLTFFTENKALNAALTLLFVSLLIFVLFTAKRKQRIIPVITPDKNTSLEFTKTIADLYYGTRNHKDIARKRLIYFNNVLQKKFNINIFDENLRIKTISEKTGIDETLLKKLLEYKNGIDNFETFSASKLTDFNKLIEKMYEIITK